MGKVTYTVDLVCCVDITASMEDALNTVKASLLRFHNDLARVMTEHGKQIDHLRVKVIRFGDYYVDGKAAINESPFFDIPQESDRFAGFVDSISATSTNSQTANGLEALALAIKSDWSIQGDVKRYVIGVWTDKGTYALEKYKTARLSGYPTNVPESFDKLTSLWNGMLIGKKRLVIYAPDTYAWKDISNLWENTIHYPSKAGADLPKQDYRHILESISRSV
ncbi:VWA domain-containing protein [Candidatus Parcubacteria bacterium]|nr:MAG: VWA domain-containing protein [Candidatus Parcubacteria bacterium]